MQVQVKVDEILPSNPGTQNKIIIFLKNTKLIAN